MYKTGLIVANCRVVVEVGKRMAELEKKAKEKVEQKKPLNRISGAVRHARLMRIGCWRGAQWT